MTTEAICSICNFPPEAEPENGWFDHVVKAEHLFLKNIYSESEMKSMDILDIENYKEIFYLLLLLDIYHHFEVALQDGFIDDEIREFMAENLCDTYETFQELRPKKPFSHKNNNFPDKIIAFLYSHFINFCRTSKAKAIPISKKFFTNMTILRNTHCVHHSHITEDIIGYAHTFCSEKVRKNQYRIPVIAHNLFRFDFLFFFLIKGLRAAVWKTRDIVIGGKNPTDINFANIGNQVQFIDTTKYFQQSLAAFASSLTSSEKAEISKTCEKYLMSDSKLSNKFLFLNKTEKYWVLDYLSSGKRAIPCKLITNFDSLSISPDKDFFELHQFYSNMKDSVLSTEEYENVKKFYMILNLSNLGELNQI